MRCDAMRCDAMRCESVKPSVRKRMRSAGIGSAHILSEIWSNAEMPSPNLRHANPPCARRIHANAHLVMLRRANCNAAPTPCRAVPCRAVAAL
jgi:hypothetical protein